VLSGQKMSAICEYNNSIQESFCSLTLPIIEKFGFTNLLCIKFLDGGKRLFLSTNASWVDCYVEHKFYDDKVHEENAIKDNDKQVPYALWDSYSTDAVFKAANSYGLWHGLYIYGDNELFSFATDGLNEKAALVAVSNINYFYQFIAYFKSVGSHLFSPQNVEDLLLHSKEKRKVSDHFTKAENENLIKFPEKIKVQYKNSDFTITKREAQILALSAFGMTGGEIAFETQLSIRTVEKHIEHIKMKSNCISKSQLVGLYHNSNLKYLRYENFC